MAHEALSPNLDQLSLMARLGVALCCFESYCRACDLVCPSIGEFLDYMWMWPGKTTQETFPAWEAAAPELVHMGLGDPMPEDACVALADRKIGEQDFRTLVEATVEIIWGSFYGACDNPGSMRHLQRVLAICGDRGITPPPLSVFGESRFADRHGWGVVLTGAQLECWRRAGAA